MPDRARVRRRRGVSDLHTQHSTLNTQHPTLPGNLGMIRALILDFDGLILDTEVPDFQSWRETFEEHGCALAEAAWTACIGMGEADMSFDPYADLEAQLGRPVDRAAICAKRRQRHRE